MNVMSTVRQVAAEFGTNDTAAAIGRINCDADVHKAKSAKRIWYHAAFTGMYAGARIAVREVRPGGP